MPNAPEIRLADAFRIVASCIEQRRPKKPDLLALMDVVDEALFHVGPFDTVVDVREILRGIRRDVDGHG